MRQTELNNFTAPGQIAGNSGKGKKMEQMTENQRKQFVKCLANYAQHGQKYFLQIEKELEINKKLFVECLAHYAQREPKHFLQIDGTHCTDDICAYRPDADDDYITACFTVELMRGATVRVLIPRDTDLGIVSLQLEKIAKLLKREPSLMNRVAARMESELKFCKENGLKFEVQLF